MLMFGIVTGRAYVSENLNEVSTQKKKLAIAERVGHESIEITLRYAHLFPTKQVEMAEKLNNEMGGAQVCG